MATPLYNNTSTSNFNTGPQTNPTNIIPQRTVQNLVKHFSSIIQGQRSRELNSDTMPPLVDAKLPKSRAFKKRSVSKKGVVIIKFQQKWCCFKPAAVKFLLPNLYATVPVRKDDFWIKEAKSHKLSDYEKITFGQQHNNMEIEFQNIDPAKSLVLVNNENSTCIPKPLSEVITQLQNLVPKYAFFSTKNEKGLFKNLFEEVYLTHIHSNIDIAQLSAKKFNIVGALDLSSKRSNAIEQRLVLLQQLRVPPTILQKLVGKTRRFLEIRKRLELEAQLQAIKSSEGEPLSEEIEEQKINNQADEQTQNDMPPLVEWDESLAESEVPMPPLDPVDGNVPSSTATNDSKGKEKL